MKNTSIQKQVRAICEAKGWLVNRTFSDGRKKHVRIKFCGIHWSGPSTPDVNVRRNVLKATKKVLPPGVTARWEKRYYFQYNYEYWALIVRVPRK